MWLGWGGGGFGDGGGGYTRAGKQGFPCKGGLAPSCSNMPGHVISLQVVLYCMLWHLFFYIWSSMEPLVAVTVLTLLMFLLHFQSFHEFFLYTCVLEEVILSLELPYIWTWMVV
jgi:hypothetical protein